jgi:uncharacterized protein YndB with AHSA1/START domain
MSSSSDARDVENPELEILSARTFDAPRERVFEAFTDPARLARWWGPKGFTNTFQEFDLRPGGTWRFLMHGPDGGVYPNESVFVEVVRPERIVFRHVSGHRFVMTMTFAEQGSGTRVTWRMRHETARECEKIRPIAVDANEQNFDRLAEELARMASG